jgi:hypothetical protein
MDEAQKKDAIQDLTNQVATEVHLGDKFKEDREKINPLKGKNLKPKPNTLAEGMANMGLEEDIYTPVKSDDGSKLRNGVPGHLGTNQGSLVIAGGLNMKTGEAQVNSIPEGKIKKELNAHYTDTLAEKKVDLPQYKYGTEKERQKEMGKLKGEPITQIRVQALRVGQLKREHRAEQKGDEPTLHPTLEDGFKNGVGHAENMVTKKLVGEGKAKPADIAMATVSHDNRLLRQKANYSQFIAPGILKLCPGGKTRF